MSSTLFVRNLPFDVTQEALEKAFGEIGPVKKVDVIKDKGKKKTEATTRGFAFVRLYVCCLCTTTLVVVYGVLTVTLIYLSTVPWPQMRSTRSRTCISLSLVDAACCWVRLLLASN